MKLLLLKTLLQRRARDEGFTLPMVIALGLVMVLLGVISLTTANEENITAISQNSKSDALAVAEVGVARYRELLDRNRDLAIYDERLSTADENAASITDTDTQKWAPRTARTEVCNNEDRDIRSFLQGRSQSVVDTQDLDNDGDTTEIIGSYSLVSYDYSNTDGVFNRTDDDLNKNAAGNDALGKLTVQGTAADNSKAQIQVDIPIRINREDLNNLAPALWIGNNTVTAAQLGNLTIGNDSDSEDDIDDDKDVSNDVGNIVIKDQATSTADGCRSFSTLASTIPKRPVISNSRNLPSIQKIINDVANARAALATPAGNLINTLPPDSAFISGAFLFGLTTDKPYNPDDKTTNCPNIKLCRYYYDPPETSGLTYTDRDLSTDGIARTTLLLDQDLTLNATTKPIKIGSTSTIVNDSNTFEIYVKGNRNITINATRNVTINGFIHAPESKLTITGGGTVNINGSVWVNDFVNNGATVNISPDLIAREPTPKDPSTSVRAYKVYSTIDEFYGGTPAMTNRPLTGSPTNWKTEEVGTP
jgi:Tfp pilus assembly protein PilX